MLSILGVHHIAIICSNYEASKKFYIDVLGFEMVRETYRASRQSYKLDLSLAGHYCLELFSFPDPPPRTSQPEAAGLRHLALSVRSVEDGVKQLQSKGINCQEIRMDEFTGKKFCFFNDPDGLPIELYEQ